MWNITPPEKGVKPDTGYNVDSPQNVVLGEGKMPVATQCVIPFAGNATSRQILRHGRFGVAGGWGKSG